MTAEDTLSVEACGFWDAAVALNRAAAQVSRSLPPLLFFTDPERTPRPWEVAAGLPPEAAVVFRGFGRPDASETAARLREVTAVRGVRLLIGADAKLAEAVGADGVHLPAREAAAARTLKAAHPDLLVTVAVHDPEAARAAEGAAALIASPIFPTASPSGRPLVGLDGLAVIVALGQSVYALGGIGPATIDDLAASGVCGVAGVEAIDRLFRVAPGTTART